MLSRFSQAALRRTAAARRVPPRPLPSAQATRTYLGGAGEMKVSDTVAAREQALWDRAQPKYDAIMERHVRLPTVDDADAAADDDKAEQELDVRRKRLVYRSKQRGWLEVDLLLGTWAAEHVPRLGGDDLDAFERFVNLETIDIYNVLTLRTDVPEDMKGAPGGEKSLVEKLQEWAKESPLGKADREKYVEVKTKNNLI